MKQKINYYVILAAAVMLCAAGCSNDEMENQSQQPDDTAESSGVEVQFTAGLAPETKTSYTSDGNTNEGFIVEWKGYDTDQTNYDKVAIYGVKKENGQLWQMGGAKHVPYRLKTSGKTSSLEPDPNPITLTVGCIYNFYSCYPYKDNGRDQGYMEVPGPKLETQTQSAPDDNAHLGKYDFMVASHTDITVNSVENPLQVNFQYKHLYTSLQFNINNKRTMPVKIEKITLARQDGNHMAFYATHDFGANETSGQGGVNSLSLTINSPQELAANSTQLQKFWMMFVPSDIPAGTELKISVYMSEGEGDAKKDYVYTLQKAAPTGSGFERGANYTLSLDVTDTPSSGKETWEMLISTPKQLTAFRDDVNGGNNYDKKTVRLTADIDLQSAEWTLSIGTDANNSFKGTFEGDGHYISNLKVNKTGDYAGLFGRVDGGTVRNLRVSGEVKTSNSRAGGIVGYADNSTVENCIFSGKVQAGNGSVGGIVGDIESGSLVIRCHTTGCTIQGTSWIGGISGANHDSTISDCYSSATIEASYGVVGGIVGLNQRTVTRCYAMGTISSKQLVGGIVGVNEKWSAEEAIVENCIALNLSLTKTEGIETTFGRIVGENSNGATITHCAAFTGMTLPVSATSDANGKDGASLSRDECLTEATYTGHGFTAENGWAFDATTPWAYLPWNKVFEDWHLPADTYRISVPAHLNGGGTN